MDAIYILNKYLVINVSKGKRVIIKTLTDVLEINTIDTELFLEIINEFVDGKSIQEVINEYDYVNIHDMLNELIEKRVLIEKIDIINIPIINLTQQVHRIDNQKLNLHKNIILIGNAITLPYLRDYFKSINNILINEVLINGNEEKLVCDLEKLLMNQDKVDIILYFDDEHQNKFISKINQVCINTKTPFSCSFFKDLKIVIGPLIIPGETPCLNCLELRKISNFEFEDFDKYSALEYIHNNNLKDFYSDINYKQISKTLCDEAIKFLYDNNCQIIGKEIIFNLINYSVSNNKVLFNPYCNVCKDIDV